MITIRNRRHAGLTLRHLRETARMTREGLGRRVFTTGKTVANRERGDRGLAVEAFIDTARALGFTVALLPDRRPGTRPTGTGWPA